MARSIFRSGGVQVVSVFDRFAKHIGTQFPQVVVFFALPATLVLTLVHCNGTQLESASREIVFLCCQPWGKTIFTFFMAQRGEKFDPVVLSLLSAGGDF